MLCITVKACRGVRVATEAGPVIIRVDRHCRILVDRPDDVRCKVDAVTVSTVHPRFVMNAEDGLRFPDGTVILWRNFALVEIETPESTHVDIELVRRLKNDGNSMDRRYLLRA